MRVWTLIAALIRFSASKWFAGFGPGRSCFRSPDLGHGRRDAAPPNERAAPAQRPAAVVRSTAWSSHRQSIPECESVVRACARGPRSQGVPGWNYDQSPVGRATEPREVPGVSLSGPRPKQCRDVAIQLTFGRSGPTIERDGGGSREPAPVQSTAARTIRASDLMRMIARNGILARGNYLRTQIVPIDALGNATLRQFKPREN